MDDDENELEVETSMASKSLNSYDFCYSSRDLLLNKRKRGGSILTFEELRSIPLLICVNTAQFVANRWPSITDVHNSKIIMHQALTVGSSGSQIENTLGKYLSSVNCEIKKPSVYQLSKLVSPLEYATLPDKPIFILNKVGKTSEGDGDFDPPLKRLKRGEMHDITTVARSQGVDFVRDNKVAGWGNVKRNKLVYFGTSNELGIKGVEVEKSHIKSALLDLIVDLKPVKSNEIGKATTIKGKTVAVQMPPPDFIEVTLREPCVKDAKGDVHTPSTSEFDLKVWIFCGCTFAKDNNISLISFTLFKLLLLQGLFVDCGCKYDIGIDSSLYRVLSKQRKSVSKTNILDDDAKLDIILQDASLRRYVNTDSSTGPTYVAITLSFSARGNKSKKLSDKVVRN